MFLDRIDAVLSEGEDHRLKAPDPARCFGTKVLSCPDCGHGIDPHGADPGGPCGVGDAQGNLCPCLMQPNGIACLLLAEMEAIVRVYENGDTK
jgi:hypothetical protein